MAKKHEQSVQATRETVDRWVDALGVMCAAIDEMRPNEREAALVYVVSRYCGNAIGRQWMVEP